MYWVLTAFSYIYLNIYYIYSIYLHTYYVYHIHNSQMSGKPDEAP